MTPQEFNRFCKNKEQELNKALDTRLPKILGAMARSHFMEGFRQGGFINASLESWKPVQRVASGAAAQYGPLLSGRNHLYNSVTYMPAPGRVVVTNPVPYAAIHNFGGTIHPAVTDRMRRYAWARYYAAGGGSSTLLDTGDPPEASRWKRLALTRKTHLSIKIPRRQFIGPSIKLTDKINIRIQKELFKILSQ